jgi:hypothetical protein
MDAVVLLADSAATDATGKVHALGLGWTMTSSPTPPMAVVVLFHVPWDQSNVKHNMVLELVDSDWSVPAFLDADLGCQLVDFPEA